MDFERLYDRKKDGSIKWNRYNEAVIPMWVADMDFEVAPPIRAAMQRYVDTGIYGYAAPMPEHAVAVKNWLKEEYDWDIKTEWIVWLPSVLSGIGTLARQISPLPYGVMTSIPVYRPFLDFAEGEGRYLQAVNLRLVEDEWTMDFEAMKAALTPETKLYILCNPHNPTGRMYTKEELTQLVDFCAEHGIVICSDDIHADLILEIGKKHIPVASINDTAANLSVSLFSAAKAFNIPALNAAFAVIPNGEIRSKFEKTKLHTVPNLGKQGADATAAALSESKPWLEELLRYLRGNLSYLQQEINAIPGLKLRNQQATYLAWIDYSELGIDNFSSVLEEYGVGVLEASVFMGEKHVRLNFGTQRANLEEAVKRIKLAVNAIRN
jgi:cystathionine beta-lyase